MKNKFLIVAVLFGFAFVTQIQAATATITLGSDKQIMRGFGVSTAWAGNMPAADAKLLWDSTAGAGLTLHRIRIAPNGTTSETSIAKQAVAYGVKVWAAPWTSDYGVVYGTNQDGTPKRHLDFTKAQLWANSILKFVQNMRAAGAPLYAVSSQNEPDGTGDNNYSPDSLALWIGSYLGPTLDSTGVKIIGPEAINWYGFPGYLKAIFNNPDAKKYTSIIATHEYGGSPAAYPQIAEAGKEFWQTEVYDLGSNDEDPGMGSALRVANVMHKSLTVASVSAWHFWWTYPCSTPSCGNGALWSQGADSKATKRLWIMGNFSRFVRPDYYRIDATAGPTSGVTMTAYRNPNKTKIVVVAINTNTSATSQAFSFSGATPVSVKPWITDESRSLGEEASQSINSNQFTYNLPSKSVTTLVFDLASTVVPKEPYLGTRAVIPGVIQFENYDVGGEGVSYHDEDVENQGGVYRTDGVDITGDESSGYKVGWTVSDEWLDYSVNVAAADFYDWSARVSMGGDDSASFSLSLDGESISPIIAVQSTGSWDTYITISGTTTKSIAAGAHSLRLKINRSFANLDWIEFTPAVPNSIFKTRNMIAEAGRYTVFDIKGQKLASISANSSNEIRSAIWAIVPRAGVYLIKPEGSSMFTKLIITEMP